MFWVAALLSLSVKGADMTNISLDRDISTVRSNNSTIGTMTPVRSRSPVLEYAIPYIPRHYDHSKEFHLESVFCFKVRRWVLQPISVALQVTAGGLFVSSQCCMDKHPEIAKILNGVGLGISVSSFVVNTLLLKIDNRLEDLDKYIMERRETQNGDNIHPAIIQR